MFNTKIVTKESALASESQLRNEQKYQLIRNLKQTDKSVIDKHLIYNILSRLKNNRSPGHINVPNEAFKFGKITLLDHLHTLINQIIYKGDTPDNMNIGLIFPLIKDKNGSNERIENTK